MAETWDAVVVGSGPNGLTAAAVIARAGYSVLVLEAAETPGGGARTQDLTLPGFRHDVCSTVHPLGASSPVFRALRLEEHGLEWREPPIALAHLLDGDRSATFHRSMDRTAEGLGADSGRYRALMAPLVRDWPKLSRELLQPITHIPRHPIALARFGVPALLPLTWLARIFQRDEAPAFLGGIAAHSMADLRRLQTASFALVLAAAGHRAGWPVARGGSSAIVDALVAAIRQHGGEIQTGRAVRTMADVPRARTVLLDVTPRQFLAMAGEDLGGHYRRALEWYRYGPGVFKADYALSGPMPWLSREARDAGTVHMGGTLDELQASDDDARRGRVPERPFVIASQQTVADPSRAPAGQHTLWLYCHVPHGCPVDMTGRIERQVDRFAPGWRDLVLGRHTVSAVDLEAYNANNVGGDIAGGAAEGLQILFRPVPKWDPYRTPIPGVYLCSAATPPGGGVHGMCGYGAARSALRRELRRG